MIFKLFDKESIFHNSLIVKIFLIIPLYSMIKGSKYLLTLISFYYFQICPTDIKKELPSATPFFYVLYKIVHISFKSEMSTKHPADFLPLKSDSGKLHPDS